MEIFEISNRNRYIFLRNLPIVRDFSWKTIVNKGTARRLENQAKRIKKKARV